MDDLQLKYPFVVSEILKWLHQQKNRWKTTLFYCKCLDIKITKIQKSEIFNICWMSSFCKLAIHVYATTTLFPFSSRVRQGDAVRAPQAGAHQEDPRQEEGPLRGVRKRVRRAGAERGARGGRLAGHPVRAGTGAGGATGARPHAGRGELPVRPGSATLEGHAAQPEEHLRPVACAGRHVKDSAGFYNTKLLWRADWRLNRVFPRWVEMKVLNSLPGDSSENETKKI